MSASEMDNSGDREGYTVGLCRVRRPRFVLSVGSCGRSALLRVGTPILDADVALAVPPSEVVLDYGILLLVGPVVGVLEAGFFVLKRLPATPVTPAASARETGSLDAALGVTRFNTSSQEVVRCGHFPR